ncbi:GNAT acetyltransferase [compost metagenome]
MCYSGFVEGRTHAIDIETTEEFRKNSYASQVAQAFVRECRERGIQPYWDCSPDNAGSIALAKGVGLSLDFNYPIFWYNLAREKEGS